MAQVPKEASQDLLRRSGRLIATTNRFTLPQQLQGIVRYIDMPLAPSNIAPSFNDMFQEYPRDDQESQSTQLCPSGPHSGHNCPPVGVSLVGTVIMTSRK